MRNATSKKGIGQAPLGVRGDNDDRPLLWRADPFARFDNHEPHFVQLEKKVVRKIPGRLVDLVDENQMGCIGNLSAPAKRVAERARSYKWRLVDLFLLNLTLPKPVHSVKIVSKTFSARIGANGEDVKSFFRNSKNAGNPVCSGCLSGTGLSG